jgi:hypothetical protein
MFGICPGNAFVRTFPRSTGRPRARLLLSRGRRKYVQPQRNFIEHGNHQAHQKRQARQSSLYIILSPEDQVSGAPDPANWTVRRFSMDDFKSARNRARRRGRMESTHAKFWFVYGLHRHSFVQRPDRKAIVLAHLARPPRPLIANFLAR